MTPPDFSSDPDIPGRAARLDDRANPRPALSTRANSNNPLYLLERFDVGVVHLDRALTVVSMNSFARRALPVDDLQPFEKTVLQFHPARSIPKVKFLLDQSECPLGNPPPMTMIINIPERVLLIKVTKLADRLGDNAGYTLIFHDITELVSHTTGPIDDPVGGTGAARVSSKRQLQKIPTVAQNRTVLVDVANVTHIRPRATTPGS